MSKETKAETRKAFQDVPPRPELAEKWAKASRKERRKIMQEIEEPEEPAMAAVRVEAER